MNVEFSVKAWGDYTYWQQTDKRVCKKINALIQYISRKTLMQE